MDQRFHDCHWGQCFELLSHLCEYSESILLVSGPHGSGKTAMKQELIDHEAEQFHVCEINATTTLTSEQLSAYIEQDLLSHDNKEMLLLIDDAQNLQLDVIAVLLQLNQKSRHDGKLHIVLFATDALESMVSRSVLKNEFSQQVHTIEIEPLTVSEVESFLIALWRQEHNTEMPLNRAKCKKIHAMSGGILGKVQEIAAETFTGKKLKEEATHSLSPITVGVTVSFGIIFCILAILWPVADKDITKTAGTTEPLTIAQQHDLGSPGIETASLSPQASSEIEATIAAAQTIPTLNSVTNVAPVIETAAVNSALEMQSQVKSSEHVEQKIALLEKKIDELQKQVDHDQKALRQAENKLMQLMGTKRNDPKVVKRSLNLSKFEKRILSLPGSNYTLQLISMQNEHQAQNFILKNKLSNRAQYYKANFKGKDWFVVVYGNYLSKLDAQAALSGLPQNLKKLRPRMREYGAIQYSINSRNKE